MGHCNLLPVCTIQYSSVTYFSEFNDVQSNLTLPSGKGQDISARQTIKGVSAFLAKKFFIARNEF